MHSKPLKISSIIIMVVNICMALIGISVFLSPAMVMGGEFQSYTGMTWEMFANSSPVTAGFMILQTYEIGVFVFIIGITASVLTLIPYKRGEKWAWVTLLFIHVFGWTGSFLVDVPTGAKDVIIMLIVLSTLAVAGLAAGALHFKQNS